MADESLEDLQKELIALKDSNYKKLEEQNKLLKDALAEKQNASGVVRNSTIKSMTVNVKQHDSPEQLSARFKQNLKAKTGINVPENISSYEQMATWFCNASSDEISDFRRNQKKRLLG